MRNSDMNRRKIWEVDIDIIGPISIADNISFKQVKGFDEDQFYSNVVLRKEEYGVATTVTAYADNAEIARTAAFVFLGRMVDILAFDNDISLAMADHRSVANIRGRNPTRRTLTTDEICTAFNFARQLEIEQPILLRAIGWYSKGKISNNALDAFLSYWNAIEIAASKYHTQTNRTESGAINKVYQSFLDYLGSEDQWNFPNSWINSMYEKRCCIAHGGEETTAEAINEISILLPGISTISRRFLKAILSEKYPDDIFQTATWRQLFD